ncbi:glutamine-rich protein 2-like [Planoprotostelium fungivorum]|uniref:Glutamine-rich protein 2-like n=1 Tax=Planoprotostelium fungivorum TaxID=1890364 RepID=A0A2P6MVZ5_9EUKA|nr:glutamine-rich protein 2-like [Planoprotostelium fungivorum]
MRTVEPVTMDVLTDNGHLKKIIEDMTFNVQTLFQTKADSLAVQRALSEKGDLKILTSKANRSYCEALVERVSKALTILTNRVDDHLLNVVPDTLQKIQLHQLKKSLAHKLDKSEYGGPSPVRGPEPTNELLSISQASNSDWGDGLASRTKPSQAFCLSCDRPIVRPGPGTRNPNIPLLPPSHPHSTTQRAMTSELQSRGGKKRTASSITGSSSGTTLPKPNGTTPLKAIHKREDEEDNKFPSITPHSPSRNDVARKNGPHVDLEHDSQLNNTTIRLVSFELAHPSEDHTDYTSADDAT